MTHHLRDRDLALAVGREPGPIARHRRVEVQLPTVGDQQSRQGSAPLKNHVVKIRQELADRARRYDWTSVLALIDRDPQLVNVTRPDGRSWYAPLHQAAHGGAPVEVVQRLVDAGAFRLLPNRDGDLPAGIAASNGHRHLLPLLQVPPVLAVDRDELDGIQREFHTVIRARAGKLVEDGIRLPELAVLTESAPHRGWFPVPGMYGGFRFGLTPTDRGWLLTTGSWCRVVGSGQRHEITAAGSRLVDEGFV